MEPFIRVSDAERQAAADQLRVAMTDGRLDLLEFDDRVARAYGAVNYGDLDQLFADLPGPRDHRSQPYPGQLYAQPGPMGQVRGTGLQILLFVVTLGVWGYVYLFQSHEEMKRHTGVGIGGVVALLVNLFVGMASPYLLSQEVGGLYERSGGRKPVSALTGLWFFPGIFILVGPLIWFILTNRALNDYWRSLGAR
jgi:hypothetical protein